MSCLRSLESAGHPPLFASPIERKVLFLLVLQGFSRVARDLRNLTDMLLGSRPGQFDDPNYAGKRESSIAEADRRIFWNLAPKQAYQMRELLLPLGFEAND